MLDAGFPAPRVTVRYAAFFGVAFFVEGAGSPLSALLAAHRFFMAWECAFRATALKCGFDLFFTGFVSGLAWDSPLIFAQRSC